MRFSEHDSFVLEEPYSIHVALGIAKRLMLILYEQINSRFYKQLLVKLANFVCATKRNVHNISTS